MILQRLSPRRTHRRTQYVPRTLGPEVKMGWIASSPTEGRFIPYSSLIETRGRGGVAEADRVVAQ